MANMSYCRFTNTSRDLEDCLDALTDREDLSNWEARAGRAMFKSFLQFCKDNWIIGDFDEQAIDDMFDAVEQEDGCDDEE